MNDGEETEKKHTNKNDIGNWPYGNEVSKPVWFVTRVSLGLENVEVQLDNRFTVGTTQTAWTQSRTLRSTQKTLIMPAPG